MLINCFINVILLFFCNFQTTSQTMDNVPVVEVQSSAPMEEDIRPREAEQRPQPKVERREELQPLTPEQLTSLYYNPGLENNTAYIDRFVQVNI
jgi:hypothetical protein